MSSLTWYELLGVERDATPAEIKAAWRDATDKFEPGSGARQFGLFNEAADVLLDPERRAAYDAEIAGESAGKSAEQEAEPESAAPDEATAISEAEPVVEGEEVDEESEPLDAKPPKVGLLGRGLLGTAYQALTSTLGLAILAVLTVASIVLASVVLLQSDLSKNADIADARTEAQSTARRALEVALSYNYQHLEQDKNAAVSYMTPEFAAKFSKPFDAISKGQETSPSTAVARKTVVEGTVQDTAVIDAGASRVRLLVYVDQKVTNIDGGPVTFENRIIATMVRSQGKWLLEDVQFLGSDCPVCAPNTTSSATPKP